MAKCFRGGVAKNIYILRVGGWQKFIYFTKNVLPSQPQNIFAILPPKICCHDTISNFFYTLPPQKFATPPPKCFATPLHPKFFCHPTPKIFCHPTPKIFCQSTLLLPPLHLNSLSLVGSVSTFMHDLSVFKKFQKIHQNRLKHSNVTSL